MYSPWPYSKSTIFKDLQVPLDYSNPTGEKAAIALIRIKAKVSSNNGNYRGPILFNPGEHIAHGHLLFTNKPPGGPGGSGVIMIDALGEFFQKLLGAEYDIVGFDPRGINIHHIRAMFAVLTTSRCGTNEASCVQLL